MCEMHVKKIAKFSRDTARAFSARWRKYKEQHHHPHEMISESSPGRWFVSSSTAVLPYNYNQMILC